MALTLEELKDRLGLESARQVRRRVDLARPLLAPYLQHGKNNQLLFNDSAVALLDRLCQLEKQGRTIEQGIEEMQFETAQTNGGRPEQSLGEPAANGEVKALHAKVEVLEQRVGDLVRMVEFLQEQNRQLLALPRPQPETQTFSQPKISRWRALKLALMGR
jgi:hypothetical protein